MYVEIRLTVEILLEKVQHSTARTVKNDYDYRSSVTELMK